MSSLYDVSIPVYTDITKTTQSILKKGEEHFKAQGKDTAELAKLRIAEDMLPLHTQVFIIVATGRKLIERVSGGSPVDTPMKEYSLAECHELLEAHLAELSKVDRGAVDPRATTEVPCKFGPEEFKASARDYVFGYPIPTGYFHLNMVYALLRGQGVPLGKKDYMAEFMKTFTKA
ncbi:hypothetical protein PG993_000062 [Apiospora rasikravindrae]|uniref:DUF1993 domain-containing protein n=1 Tax=Apiospora rasikravindrae TaxID=990691 RepID=A0ABR1U7I5_9PEZI